MSLPLSPAGRRYAAKRDFHDYRDHLLPARMRATHKLKELVDERPFCGPIKNQLQTGSCTGHAGTSDFEWIDRKYFKASRVFSPMFLYSNELLMEGTFPEDDGAQPRTICKVLTNIGCCEETDDPYGAGQITQPMPAEIEAAGKHKMGGYHRLQGLQDFLLALSDPTPWPVLVAFSVYESFESQKVADTGVMPVPDVAKEACLGGHEVLAVGYDLKKHVAIIQNSWGADWGDKGFFLMPLSVIANPDLVSDLWVVHPGIWEAKPAVPDKAVKRAVA